MVIGRRESKSRHDAGERPPTCTGSPWIIEWNNRRLTVLMARNPVVARLKARFRQNCKDDGWQGLGSAKIRRVRRVSAFELEVASRAELNRPKFGYVRIHGTVITWTGPREAMTPPRDGGASAEILSGKADGIRVPSCGLWSYVWSNRELVLLAAQDFDAACDRAERFRATSKHIKVANLIEPVPRFELQLAEGHGGHAPTCFRLWIDGYKVGWPPTKDQESRSDDLPPDTPLGAEARLPIPIYAHTYAYGPGPQATSFLRPTAPTSWATERTAR